MTELIQLNVTAARSQIHAGDEPQVVYLRVVGHTTVKKAPRTPLNLCLTIDRSSSMRGERLYQVKEAARHLINQLGPEDVFTLVAFNDWAEAIVPASCGANRAALHQALNNLEARGGTEMAQGLALGLQEIERSKVRGLNRLILLTDGRTYGDEHSCIELARRAQKRGIGLTALGVGTEWNEDLLETMTSGENSLTQYITDVGEIVPVFEAELKRLHNTIAQGTEMFIIAHPQTTCRNMHRVLPFVAPMQPHVVSPGRWRVPLGEWPVGDDQHFMLELIIPPVGAGPQVITKLEMRYEEVGAATTLTSSVTVATVAQTVPDPAINPDVQQLLQRVTAYRVQSGAWQSLAEGRVAEGTQRLKQASTHLFNAGEVELAAMANAEAARLSRSGSTSSDGRKRIKYGTRGLLTQQQKT